MFKNFYSKKILNEVSKNTNKKLFENFEKKNKMKVVILAGGKGSRLSEYTSKYTKTYGQNFKIPILIRIINYYKKIWFLKNL